MIQASSLSIWLQPRESKFPAWYCEAQLASFKAFTEAGWPTRKQEAWKYHDLNFLKEHSFTHASPYENDLEDMIHQHRLQKGDSILLVMVNGYFMSHLSDLKKLPNQAIVCDLQTALSEHENLLKTHLSQPIDAKHYPFALLNTALSQTGLFFYLPRSCVLADPIHFLSLTIGDASFMMHPKNFFIVDDKSELSLVEEYFSLSSTMYWQNVSTTIIVGKEAKLHHYKLQQEGYEAVHFAHTHVQQAEESKVNLTQFSFGGRLSREDIVVSLEAPHATCSAAGFYETQSNEQTLDHHVMIHHKAAHSESEMLYKGILDQRSRAIFNGRLYVEKDAQKIIAHQANHNLLLSPEAEVNSKPELEIYAEDVKCKHAATIGQLNQDALFYLRSRGIDEVMARSMLLQSFAEEIINRIPNESIRLRVGEMLPCK